MLIAVDIGNTNIVVGAFDGAALLASWRTATNLEATADEYGALFDTLFRLHDLGNVIEGAVIGSVVPAVQSSISETARRYWKVVPLLIAPNLNLGIEVRYGPPQAVGADRIANAVAAIDGYGTPAIVVDFGTATTFDIISRDAAYLGGAIAPGLEIAQEALFARTAQLPRVPLEPPESAIGTTTVTSLQSGILFGYAGLIDGLVERIQPELGGGAEVVATGGLASVVAPLTRTVQHVDPDLTLIGLRLLYERNMVNALGHRARQA